jgi:hypothetical protein
MQKKNAILTAIQEQLESDVERRLSIRNYERIPEIMLYLMLCNKRSNKAFSTFQKHVLQFLIDQEAIQKKHGFLKGSMGTVFLLSKVYEATGYVEYKNHSVEIAFSFCEYLPADLSLDTGLSGTTLGYLHLHGITKSDWIMEDVNIYVNFLVDKLKIDEDGLYYNHRGESNISLDLNVCIVFMELGRHFSNQGLSAIGLKLYNSAKIKIDCQPGTEVPGMFWQNRYFAFGVVSLILFKFTKNFEFLRNFNTVFTFIMSQQGSPGNQLHLLYLLKISNTFLKRNSFAQAYKNAIASVIKSDAWLLDPLMYGNLIINYDDPKLDGGLSYILPTCMKRKTLKPKNSLLFKNILDMPQQALQERILQNNNFTSPKQM